MEERQQFGTTRCRDERGQILPLVALLIAGASFALIALGLLGGRIVDRANVSTAADAAALAGAAAGAGEADRVARANGVDLVDFERIASGGDGSREVRVRVRRGVDTASARARAERQPRAAPPEGAAGLAPAMRAAVRRAEALLGRPVPITSGHRSGAEQLRLWRRRAANPFPVAAPGTSMHERGLAIDVPRAFVPTLLTVAADAGLCHPLPDVDPVHFEVCGRGFTAGARG